MIGEHNTKHSTFQPFMDDTETAEKPTAGRYKSIMLKLTSN